MFTDPSKIANVIETGFTYLRNVVMEIEKRVKVEAKIFDMINRNGVTTQDLSGKVFSTFFGLSCISY